MNLRIFGGFEIRMQFFLLTPLFEYYLRDYIYVQGGGANVTSLYIATPTFYSHAHKDFSLISVVFLHRSIENWPSGVPSKGTRIFVGVALGA